MTTSNLTPLLSRVEEATGPDRELDRDIAEHFYPEILTREHRVVVGGQFAWQHPTYGLTRCEHYTASLDAALALCERVLPGWLRFVGDLDPTDPRATATVCQGLIGSLSGRGFAPRNQYALALLAALLRAKIAEAGQ